MNYTIDIIDLDDDSHDVVLRFAEQASIQLHWHGTDGNAEQNIVGSSLDFTLEVNIAEMQDGFYKDLFTGDEDRFRVRFYTDDDVTVWSGFLLPDSYKEPYSNGTTYVQFTAVDGMGRLKGKYMTDFYYEEEQPLPKIISQCLLKTNLFLEIYFAPAISNLTAPDYEDIYISGLDFLDKGQPMDCYQVLQKICSSMLCTVYQADDRWYFEGFNKRHKKEVAYKVYNQFGFFDRDETVLRLIKAFKGLDIPEITSIPPANRAVVYETRTPIGFPDSIAEEKNDGWAIGQGVDGQIFPTYWYANGGYLPEAPAPDYNVALRCRADGTLAFDASKFISLKELLYVDRFQKMVFRGSFKAEVDPSQEDPPTANGLRLEFVLNGTVIFTVERTFTDKELDIKFDLFPTTSGNLDLRLYQPFWGGTIADKTYSNFITVQELSLDTVGFQEDVVTQIDVNDGHSTPKELTLDFSDDASGFTPCFRLDKLLEKDAAYNEIDVPILHQFSQNGKNFAQVSLYGANLAADNIKTVYRENQPINTEVFYNYLKGEQMVLSTPQLYTYGDLQVRRYKVKPGPQDRSHWQQWTDTEYPIDRDRYATAAAKVLGRLFTNDSERVDYVADNAIKFNDLVEFNYMLSRYYFPVNVTWNVDTGETTLSMVRAQYANDVVDTGGENIPPIVNAGADVLLPANFPNVRYTHTTASAYDPDGFIASITWGVANGDQNAVITGRDQLQPTIVSFSGNEIELSIKVIDSEGAFAQDTVILRKRNSYTIGFNNTTDDNVKTPPGSGKPNPDFQSFYYSDFTVTPELKENETMTVRGNWQQLLSTSDQYHFDNWRCVNFISIVKNGNTVMQSALTQRSVQKGDFEFNYIKGDAISFRISLYTDTKNSFVTILNTFNMESEFEINEVVFQQGGGDVNGYPVSMEDSLTGY